MRAGIVVNVTRADRLRLEAIIADRSTPQKHVWRAQAWQAPAAAQHRSAGSRFGLGAAAGREHPLDGPGTCQGGRSEPAFGATHPGSSPTRAAPYPDVQTVEGPGVC